MLFARLWRSVLVIGLTVVAVFPVRSSAQTTDPVADPRLEFLVPVRGQISDQQTEQEAEQRWTFEVVIGQMISLQAQGVSGTIQPQIELINPGGAVVAMAQLTSYRTVTIDGYIVEQAGLFTVRVKPTQPGASGAFTLQLLPGHSFLLVDDRMQGRTVFRSWREPNAISQLVDGRLRLQLRSARFYTWTTADTLGTIDDGYVQMQVTPEQFNGYWEYGIALRGSVVDGGLNAYVFMINSANEWRVVIARGNRLDTVRDWSPLMVQLGSSARFGVAASGNNYTLYLDDRPIGSVQDARLSGAGLIGVTVGTGAPPSDFVAVLFDNLTVTLPAARTDEIVFSVPTEIESWQSAETAIMSELITKRVAPGQGRSAIRVVEAYVTNNTGGGIVYIPLARDVRFTNLIFGAELYWDTNTDQSACAVEIRASGPNEFTIVYVDRMGSFGIRQQGLSPNGENGVIVQQYERTDAIDMGNRASNRIVIVAIGTGLLIYLNGALIADANVEQATGSIFLAAYNYATAANYCQFRDVWLRAYD